MSQMADKTDRYYTSFKNLKKAFVALQKSASSPVQEPRDLSGIVKDFELVYELAWKTLKRFLEKQGHEVKSAKDAFAKGYQLQYLDHQDGWLSILKDRNLTVHIYDEKFAREMCDRIINEYVSKFEQLIKSLENHSEE